MYYVTHDGLKRAYYIELKTDINYYGWRSAEITFETHQNRIKSVLKNFSVGTKLDLS